MPDFFVYLIGLFVRKLIFCPKTLILASILASTFFYFNSGGRFGVNKVYQTLKADGIPCTLKKVSGLMQEMGLKSKGRKTSVGRPKKKKENLIYFYPGNLLKQNFN